MPLTADKVGGAAVASSSKRPVPSDVDAAVASPPRTATPPPQTERFRLEARTNVKSSSSRHSLLTGQASDISRNGGFDIDALDHGLRRELSRQQRESTPGASPHRKRQRINGDR